MWDSYTFFRDHAICCWNSPLLQEGGLLSPKSCGCACQTSKIGLSLPGGGGHWPRKGVWGCAAVMTPFFQATRRSLAYQFTIIAPLLCPPFSNFIKIFNFKPCFGQNFSSQDANFPNFCSLDPSFFKENPLPKPYFWKPVWHTPTKKKKVECPPRAFSIPTFDPISHPSI